ncbi:MAG TPA: glycosyltransferase [Pyrinomonadaceae bacterium]|jgi:glycosyltransferase involved in cell wall biosynthesis|nr:glycosyltransferase [Pyrinomonadaceae bacterium]
MTSSPANSPDVSVIVATYNRCDVVRGAVESLMNQDSGGTSYEVIVVDNNSTDETRRTLEELCSKYDNLFYHFEAQQGVSYARNRGIAAARAPILAFTDDDIKPASDWVASVSEGFKRFPEADCIGGKVLPQTETEFPVWLTGKHWTPLALLDMGDQPVVLDVLNGPGLVAANLAVRAAVFKDVGLFQPELQRVKSFIGSLEDHEFEMRLGAAKKRLMYLPELIVYAQVLDERLNKAYHRRWYRGHGYFYALMRNQQFESSKARLFDVPSHLYRRTCSNVVDWVRYRVKRNEELQLQQELELEFFWGFFRKRFADLFK